MSTQNLGDNDPVSLDSVFKALTHWRNNKHSYEEKGIPGQIWDSIFQLEAKGYARSELRRMFGLNSAQYSKKRSQAHKKTSKPDTKSANTKVKIEKNSPAAFSQAVVVDDATQGFIPPLATAAQQTKRDIAQLKTPDNQPERYLDMSTVVIECIRPDGHRLKIHTTNERLDVVMQSFFATDGGSL